ncbi:MAG: hypothetical protein DYG94_02970 [Leptolyngbya sp. PLA3]|nr:MAG: hypothetical protein EDM82_11330 [Cyanobacteria bacterium CYA]MCE7967691.1 hypothetical protein [Leptolyngbya sp. PL-A3]
MRTRQNRGLIALNLLLLAVLGAVTLPPIASAQNQRGRTRGEYTMVGGELDVGGSDAVFIVDSANAEMIVLRWENGRRRLEGVGFRDLDLDSRADVGR